MGWKFSDDYRERMQSAQGVRSTSAARQVKLGRKKTKIAGCRGFLRAAGAKPTPHSVTMTEIQALDQELQVLIGARSIGDALCGDPHAPNPNSRGVGMERGFGRGVLVDQTNVDLAAKCLIEAGDDDAVIAALAGCDSQESWEAWTKALPTREQALVARPPKATPAPTATPAATPAQRRKEAAAAAAEEARQQAVAKDEADLQRRIDSMPPEERAFFDHMTATMEADNAESAATV